MIDRRSDPPPRDRHSRDEELDERLERLAAQEVSARHKEQIGLAVVLGLIAVFLILGSAALLSISSDLEDARSHAEQEPSGDTDALEQRMSELLGKETVNLLTQADALEDGEMNRARHLALSALLHEEATRQEARKLLADEPERQANELLFQASTLLALHDSTFEPDDGSDSARPLHCGPGGGLEARYVPELRDVLEQASAIVAEHNLLDPRSDYLKGKVAFLDGNSRAARLAFETAMQRDPNFAPAVSAAARLATIEARWKDASELAERHSHLAGGSRKAKALVDEARQREKLDRTCRSGDATACETLAKAAGCDDCGRAALMLRESCTQSNRSACRLVEVLDSKTEDVLCGRVEAEQPACKPLSAPCGVASECCDYVDGVTPGTVACLGAPEKRCQHRIPAAPTEARPLPAPPATPSSGATAPRLDDAPEPRPPEPRPPALPSNPPATEPKAETQQPPASD